MRSCPRRDVSVAASEVAVGIFVKAVFGVTAADLHALNRIVLKSTVSVRDENRKYIVSSFTIGLAIQFVVVKIQCILQAMLSHSL
jgi:hypothetical protein